MKAPIHGGGRKVPSVNKGKSKARPAPPPRTDVQSGGGYRIPKKLPAPPRPSFGRPIGAVPVAPPKPRPLISYRGTQVLEQERKRAVRAAQRRRNAQLAAEVRLGAIAQALAPFKRELPDSHAPVITAPVLRDSGVANNYSPQVRGVVLSPQQIRRDQAAIQRPGAGMGRIVERLRAAGVADAPATGLERQEAAAAFRRQLEAQAWALQRVQNANDANIAIGATEFKQYIRDVPTAVLAERIAELSKPENVQRMGFDPTSIGGLIQGTASGLSDLTRKATGHSLLGNAAHDILMWPTWAVPAAYSAATDPGAFVEGLTEGVIGNVVQGDLEGAKRAFREHPVFSLAEIRGGASAVARPPMALARNLTKGRVFGTDRAPINLTGLAGSAAYIDRRRSKDPVIRAAQALSDAILTKPGESVRVPGKGRVPARVFAGDRRLVGGVAEGARVHALNRMTDYNRASGVTAQQTLRDDAIEIVRLSKINSKLGRAVAKYLDIPARPASPDGYQGVIGRVAAKAAEKAGVGRFLTDPNAQLVSLVLRGIIKTEGGVTARSVARDLDHRIAEIRVSLETPGAYKSVPDWEQAAAHVALLEGIRDSGRASAQVAQMAKRLAPEFKKNTDELVRLGALAKEAGDRAPLFTAAMTHLGYDYKDGALRNAEGNVVPTEQVRAELRERGVDPDVVSHLPHMPLGQGAYYKQDTQSRRNADTHSLTGAMHKRGESAFEWDHVEASLAHGRTLAANIRSLDQFVHDTGVRVGKGTWKETVQAARNSVDTEGRPHYVAMRRVGSRIDPDRQETARNLQDVETNTQLTKDMFDERLKAPDQDGPDVAVLVPRQAVDRAKEHVKGGGASIASMQALSSQFRQTVLPFSTKWMFGNVAEAVLRTAMVTVNPLDRRTARVALDRMIAEDALAVHGGNPRVAKAARQLIELGSGAKRTVNMRAVKALRAELMDYAPNARTAEMELTGGLFFGAKGQTVRRTQDELGFTGRQVSRLGRLPIINEYMAMTRWLGRKGFAINRLFEREAQYTALGKHVRNELETFSGRWQSGIRLNDKALQEFSRGLLGTPAQLKAANWLDETLGRYSRFSPTTRKWIQTYTPFLPWYLNAIRFTMVTLPAKHPIKFALWTSAERTFEQDWEDQHKDIPPGYGDFFASIPTKDEGYKLGITQSTPFGLLGPIGGGGDFSDFSALMLPQFSGTLAALRGKDPFGQDLALPNGDTLDIGDYAKIAGNSFLESVIPLLNMGRRLREQAGTSLATSTILDPQIKPGSEGNKGRGESAANRVFNAPFRTTYLRPGGEASGPVRKRKLTREEEMDRRLDEILSRGDTGPSDDLDRRLDRLLGG